MEIFFLIAGFFARLVIERRGLAGFIRQRTTRILIPFIVGWFLLYPPILLIWIWGHSISHSLDTMGIPPDQWNRGPVRLTLDSFKGTELFANGVNLGHLWFLYYLLMIYAIFLGIRALAGLRPLEPIASRFLGSLDSQFLRLMQSRWKILGPAVPSALFVGLMEGGVTTPNRSMVPDWPVLAIYGFCFLVGWMLHRQPGLWNRLVPGYSIRLAIGLALVLPTAYGGRLALLIDPAGRHGEVLFALHCVLYGIMMWAFVLGLAGLFTRWIRAESPFWRYVADSSYWIYLVHLLVVVPLQILLAGVDLHWVIKYPLINLIAFPILFLSYDLLVRNTWVGRILNGRRYPRALTAKWFEPSPPMR